MRRNESDTSAYDWNASPWPPSVLSVVAYRVTTSEASHSTDPAERATDRLSSSVIGIVSTNAAVITAMGTASHAKSGGTPAGRHQSASAIPAIPPATMKVIVPATVFSGFHGQRAPPIARPASVA